MSELNIDHWDPTAFDDLKTLLLRVTSPHITKSVVTSLLRQLDLVTPWINQLTQFPTTSAAERQETEKSESNLVELRAEEQTRYSSLQEPRSKSTTMSSPKLFNSQTTFRYPRA
jgi:hypothetical protein